MKYKSPDCAHEGCINVALAGNETCSIHHKGYVNYPKRAERLEYLLRELIGTVDEYTGMPCSSLRHRMVASSEAAQNYLDEGEE